MQGLDQNQPAVHHPLSNFDPNSPHEDEGLRTELGAPRKQFSIVRPDGPRAGYSTGKLRGRRLILMANAKTARPTGHLADDVVLEASTVLVTNV
jgi:hypothetical protein